MRARSLSHLSDGVLIRELKSLVGREREATASVVAHMAEVDARRLYAPAGYPSMHAWCVAALNLSEDAAFKSIQAARAVRRFPAILDALADGRLHLSGVKLLAPYLTHGNAGELLRAAGGRTRRGIEQLLAERFPRTESMPLVEAEPRPIASRQQAPGPVQNETVMAAAPLQTCAGTAAEPANGVVAAARSATHAPPAAETHGSRRPFAMARPAPAQAAAPPAKLAAIAPERFTLRLTMSKAMYDRLEHVQALLSHSIPAGDLAQVLDRVLELAIAQLEKGRFAKTPKPRTRRPPSRTNTRYIPAHVKREVFERDQGCCTFVSASDKRCGSRRFLEFDHVLPVARGGPATVRNIRLRCRAHNHYEAELAFGAGFMQGKRERACGASRQDGGATRLLQARTAGGRPASAPPKTSYG